MKSVEDRLREMPVWAEETGLRADDELKRKILRRVREQKKPAAGLFARRLAPVMCAAAVLLAVIFWPRTAILPGEEPLLSIKAMGSGAPAGEKLALDVPTGSISIRSSSNPSYRSIWAPASGANFPMIGVKGRYFRLMSNPTSISSSMLGSALGTVDLFTGEPALAGKSGICSNAVAEGETVYAVSGMDGALAAARVNGQMRVFQRVSFGDSALVGGESLADTLKAGSAVALELSNVGTINDAATAQRLIGVLTRNASFVRSGAGESNQSLLIQLSNGIVIQMAVNGERLLACGTWACPEFFEEFQKAMQ